MDVDEPQNGAEVHCNGEKRWSPGDRVTAFWAGNSSYYPATVAEVSSTNKTITVTWDDNDDSHRTVELSKVMDVADDVVAWSSKRIDSQAIVRHTAEKGRCLFVNQACDPGKVVFVEQPLLVALPAKCPALWQHLQQLQTAQPLNLGTVTFHYAALLSELLLDPVSLDVILDKFVPEPDEEPGEDALRILHSFQENEALVDELKLREVQLEPRRFQRLVSSWRYNAFGHHKEDGLVLYNRISMCAHSCDPSCCWSYGNDDAFVLRARVLLPKGAELTISYLQDEDLLRSIQVRQTKLQNWRFTCQCERCSLQIDVGRGFRCRKCNCGICFVVKGEERESLSPCSVCGSSMSSEDTKLLLDLEQEYVVRVDKLDKTDLADVRVVFQAALDMFECHWILYVMDTMLWEGLREKDLHEAMSHQQRRILFHEHYYNRPTFILAWSHEELGDSLQSQYEQRKWQYCKEFQRAYHILCILCGMNHQYSASPYNKLWQATHGPIQAQENSCAQNPPEELQA
mmetsp:Transcript_52977/g.124097  ORF Transcript_52977/g.124097 Transcript_52977/m.124097 type:complete len:514 (+) Transcript_52977:102-1643(+)